MNISKTNSLLAGAALLALLAGCGSGDSGGGSADPAGSSSLGTKAASAAGAAESTQETSAAVSNGNGAVTEEGVSAEVLASILVSNTYSVIGRDRPYPLYFGMAAVQWSGPVPGGTQVVNPTIPNTYGTQQVYRASNDASYGTSMMLSVRSFGAASGGNGPQPLEGGFRDLDVNLGMEFSMDDVTVGDNGYIKFKPEVAAQPGNLLLSLGKNIEVRNRWDNQVRTAQSDSEFELRAGETIPYYQVLKRWEGADSVYNELILFKGEKAGEVRLCHNTGNTEVKRLNCSLWRVESNWTFGGARLEDTGAYIVDDRSTYSGQSGWLFWQTPEKSDEARNTDAQQAAAEQPAAEQPAAAQPIAEQPAVEAPAAESGQP
ncbi:MAG: hypothetical protein Q4A16_07400 [Lautropia sp.]|nr:hypothetical protein [Lautropia sp.]